MILDLILSIVLPAVTTLIFFGIMWSMWKEEKKVSLKLTEFDRQSSEARLQMMPGLLLDGKRTNWMEAFAALPRATNGQVAEAEEAEMLRDWLFEEPLERRWRQPRDGGYSADWGNRPAETHIGEAFG